MRTYPDKTALDAVLVTGTLITTSPPQGSTSELFAGSFSLFDAAGLHLWEGTLGTLALEVVEEAGWTALAADESREEAFLKTAVGVELGFLGFAWDPAGPISFGWDNVDSVTFSTSCVAAVRSAWRTSHP